MCSFKPISDLFSEKSELYYNESLMNELEESYHEQLKAEMISQYVYNVRIRGIKIVQVEAEHIQMFLSNIFKSRAKSMDQFIAEAG